MSDDKKLALLGRIRALRAKTTDAGCTEAEALAAAALAAKLLDSYGFSEDDLTLPPEKVTEDSYFAPGKRLDQMIFVISAVADFCDCKSWSRSRDGKIACLTYFGRESDMAVAMYLTHLIYTAMWSEWAAFLPNKNPAQRNGVQRRAFQRGMMYRLSERLREMKATRNAAKDARSSRIGKDLVVLKNAVVEEAWAKRNLTLKQSSSRGLKASGALVAGYAAGNNVALSDGIANDGKEVRRIR